MVERAADYEWRGEGEGAEVVLYAPEEGVALSAFDRILPATRLPGVESPVYAAASPEALGWVAASTSHAAPDLISVPARGLLLVADVALGDLGVPPEEVPRVLQRRLSEVRLPHLAGAGLRRICDEGARAAAEDDLIEEEDLQLLDPRPGDADALGRRAISAGTREWDHLGEVGAYGVKEVLDTGAAEGLGLDRGPFALVISAGAGDLGRLASAGHRERILSRVRGGDFGAQDDLPAAPVGSEEGADLLAAVDAAANFADGRAALLLYTLRRALEELAGELSLRAAWGIGGIEIRDGSLVHRSNLAAAAEGKVLVSGGSVVAGTGKMSGGVPPFGALGDDGLHPWEEAELLERWADLDPLRGES
jgi:tRNA-splicing ligase RtcB